MPMTSLNISLPEVLKAYVEGQVATGDWGTPSEYIRELIRQDKERRMTNLEQELLAAAKGPKIEVSISQIRKKGLISALRERARRARKNCGLLSVMQRLQIFWSSLMVQSSSRSESGATLGRGGHCHAVADCSTSENWATL